MFPQWQRDMADIASCENVVAKLGGMAMIDNGFGWHLAPRPPSSEEFVAAQGRYYAHMIECFGSERCMFESNFPIDRFSVSYRSVLELACKRMAADYSAAERGRCSSGPPSGSTASTSDRSSAGPADPRGPSARRTAGESRPSSASSSARIRCRQVAVNNSVAAALTSSL
ncbi:MAG: amidohydrolase family protein [Ilumatobacteraceae bacterium]